jgi:SH3-like domain-containing protein
MEEVKRWLSEWMAIIAQSLSAMASLVAATVSVVIHRRVRDVEGKVEQVHVATNSMKDALVKTTAEASKAEGRLEMKTEMKQEAAVKEQGKLEGLEQGRKEK